eukprot:1948782-Heterocapsa_arctica.AAC.1
MRRQQRPAGQPNCIPCPESRLYNTSDAHIARHSERPKPKPNNAEATATRRAAKMQNMPGV